MITANQNNDIDIEILLCFHNPYTWTNIQHGLKYTDMAPTWVFLKIQLNFTLGGWLSDCPFFRLLVVFFILKNYGPQENKIHFA